MYKRGSLPYTISRMHRAEEKGYRREGGKGIAKWDSIRLMMLDREHGTTNETWGPGACAAGTAEKTVLKVETKKLDQTLTTNAVCRMPCTDIVSCTRKYVLLRHPSVKQS